MLPRSGPLLVVLAFLLPLAPVPAVSAAPGAPQDLLEIELDDVVLPVDSAWVVERASAPLTLNVPQGNEGVERVSVPIKGIDVFSFEATITDGELKVLVDGRGVLTLGPGTHVRDIALPPTALRLEWEFIASTIDGALQLVLGGARPALAPVLQGVPWALFSDCDGPVLRLRITFAPRIDAESLVFLVDGLPVSTRAQSVLVGTVRETFLTIPLARPLDGATISLDLDLRDALGRVWSLLDAYRVRHHRSDVLSAGPHGTVYDLAPTIWAGSYCATMEGKLRFFLDDVERTDELWRHAHRAGFVARDLRFGESRVWRFELTLSDGLVVKKAGTIRGGLDVMEWEADEIALMWVDATRPAYVPSDPGEGQALLADLADGGQMPPLLGKTPSGLAVGKSQVVEAGGVKLRAVYSPEAMRCDADSVCQPYGNRVKGWLDPSAANLTIVGESGKTTVLPGAGQFAAASRTTAANGGDHDDSLIAPAMVYLDEPIRHQQTKAEMIIDSGGTVVTAYVDYLIVKMTRCGISITCTRGMIT